MNTLPPNKCNKASLTPLVWDRFIYPRGKRSQQTVSAYIEALDIGARFPPIRVQRVFNYTDEQGNGTPEEIVTIIIDGIHRWSAFKEKGLKEIETIEFKDQPIDYQENKTALLLESAKCNTSHGDRLSSNDKKRIARDIASSDPERRYTESALAEKLGVSQQTVNAWITDIRARQKTNRDSIIIRGISTNVMKDSGTTGPAASLPSLLPIHCSILQNRVTLFLIPHITPKKQRNMKKKPAKLPLPYHLLQKRSMKLFLKIFSPWPMTLL